MENTKQAHSPEKKTFKWKKALTSLKRKEEEYLILLDRIKNKLH